MGAGIPRRGNAVKGFSASIKDPVLEVHPQSRPLGNLDYAVVHLERLLQGLLVHVRGEGRWVVRKLQLGRIGNRCGQVQVRDHSHGVSPRVGDNLDPRGMRHCGKRSRAPQPFAKGDVWLQNIITPGEEQSLQLGQAVVTSPPEIGIGECSCKRFNLA